VKTTVRRLVWGPGLNNPTVANSSNPSTDSDHNEALTISAPPVSA
jgi:hypothetical protein